VIKIGKKIMNLDFHASNVLLAVDGSVSGQTAIKFVSHLPLPSGAIIHLLSVLAHDRSSNRDELTVALERASDLLEAQGMRTEKTLMVGNPALQIAHCGEQINCDLVVMGAKGSGANSKSILGSVAQQVVELARQPVLVVRDTFSELRSILFVTDGSDCSRRTLAYLMNFCRPDDLKMTVAHVLPPPITSEMLIRSWGATPVMTSPLPARIEEDIAAWNAEEEHRGKQLLTATAIMLAQAGWNAKTLLLHGDPAEEIIQAIRQYPIDLVMVGSRGTGRIKGWLMGGVARKLVYEAGCSVLVVK
jgi:nucleotide-binding universal stress UspA family protein